MQAARRTRAEQRDATRSRIIDASLLEFGRAGFEGASTRSIARAAGVTQGLLTHHFESKDDLWKAAVDKVFGELSTATSRAEADPTSGDLGTLYNPIEEFVRFSASRPELLSIMIDAGRRNDGQMTWLTENHLSGWFEGARRGIEQRFPGLPDDMVPHLFYAVVGASSLIFAVRNECIAVSGVDPNTEDNVARHADLIASLMAGLQTPGDAPRKPRTTR